MELAVGVYEEKVPFDVSMGMKTLELFRERRRKEGNNRMNDVEERMTAILNRSREEEKRRKDSTETLLRILEPILSKLRKEKHERDRSNLVKMKGALERARDRGEGK